MAEPEVYKSGADSFVVFGEVRVEDLNAQAQNLAAERVRQEANQQAKEAADDDVPELLDQTEGAGQAEEKGEQSQESGEAVDETGLEQKDIELVMQQANVSRPKAVKALKKTNNDIVNAIMVLFFFENYFLII